jgi:shikimate dehydrogenase
VNATPVGMTPEVDASVWPDPIPFPKGSFVYDLVYNPTQTRLMQQAQAASSHSANGLGMLIQQAALAFQLWTGQDPDLEVLKSVVQELVLT